MDDLVNISRLMLLSLREVRDDSSGSFMVIVNTLCRCHWWLGYCLGNRQRAALYDDFSCLPGDVISPTQPHTCPWTLLCYLCG